MKSRVDCHIRYDPEVDVALLSFMGSSSDSGGPALEFDDETGLAGLVRLGGDGEFDHLEILGAKRAVPRLVSKLRTPPPGVRDYCRGVVDVPMTVCEERGAVRFGLVDTPSGAREYEVPVRVEPPSSIVAALRYDGESGVLRSLTLFPSGGPLREFLGTASG
ncbi:hypothetical protein [Streptomyces sudanensis]|uniref:hypothetical protein n=1 Tax=Streptomyces sudanensis TaxID=436397 RepID=UPI0020CDA796|nr:hypothetical protein [Streptomyces sudanensis]MCP9957873.1 hypothetical protein [Streptomyces sudanensis]MCQ0001593.1 hypothetical protein [Streptomyces sudanensis]